MYSSLTDALLIRFDLVLFNGFILCDKPYALSLVQKWHTKAHSNTILGWRPYIVIVTIEVAKVERRAKHTQICCQRFSIISNAGVVEWHFRSLLGSRSLYLASDK